MRKDEIAELEVSSLIPYARNNKIHNRKQLDKLKAVIKEHGYDVYIVVDEDNVILKGHGRHEVITELGWDKVKCIKRYGLTKTEKKAIRIEDNKIAELAEWDNDMLALELKDLADSDFDIETLGFDIEEVNALDNLLEGDLEDNEIIEDEVPEVEENPYSKMGDLWLLGSHRLLCGDSTDEATVARLMDGKKADMVFTDPPYGMFLDADYSDMNSKFKGSTGGNAYEKVIGDNDDFKPELINTVFKNFGYCKEIFIWGADYFTELLENKNAGSWVVWDKRSNDSDDIKADESSDKMFGSTFELCWSKARHKRAIARVKWAGIFGLEKEHDKKRHHPTQKPVKLVVWFLDFYSIGNKKNVVDLYGGSGCTILGCEQKGKNSFTIELDEKYVDVIVKRYHNLGKDDITLIRDGKEYKWEEIKSEIVGD